MPKYVPDASHSHFPDANNTEAEVVLEAIANRQREIAGFTFSYSATPDEGSTVTITNGATVVYKHFVTAGGIGPVAIPVPLNIAADINTALTGTLSASASCKGSLTLHVVE